MNKAKRAKGLVFAILAAFALCVVLVWFAFQSITNSYHKSIANESAEHLIETGGQVKLFLEEQFANDHEIATSLANSISLYGQEDVGGLVNLIRRERDIWGLSAVYIYAENGFCVGTDGDVKRNDAATDIIYNARKYGEYMSIVQSTITYSLPVENALAINGSPMAAVSIVKDIASLVDNMGFSSFDGEAYIYLTQDNGTVISKLTHPQAHSAYNIFALLEQYDAPCLSHGAHIIGTQLPLDDACAFLYRSDDEKAMYMVTTPVRNGEATMRMFYFVPEEVVNSTMLGFSSTITSMSYATISAFTLCVVLAFALIYRARKRSFDSALVARDRMFDLLVSNTRNAFALLSAGQRQPLYISSNAGAIIGDEYMWLEKTPQGTRMAFPSGGETDTAREINLALESWDGKSDFISGFMPYMAEGRSRYFVMRIYPVGGRDEEFVVIAQDVTFDREREEALKTALARADSASLAKSRFLSNMSHDIRTPMNAIINMTEFAMETTGEPDKLMSYLRTIRESSDHLLRLINDILDMSRIESGQVVAGAEPFELRTCLGEVHAIIAPLAAAKGQVFASHFPGGEPIHITGDKLKLTRVLVNLLNNAVKFTEQDGHISLTVEELPSWRPDSATFRFTVADDGPGISDEQVEHIFEPFSRGCLDSVSGTEGAGLGLSICKSYVAALGGSIVCESAPGAGSTFIVELFFERAPGQSGPEAKPAENIDPELFQGKRALLCEDNSINQAIAQKILKKLGFAVDTFDNGSQAAAAFAASPAGCYHIIYMDIQMPIMDGYQATRTIRNSGHPDAKTIPIIAMTADVFAEDVEKARAAGMNGHLGKPLRMDELTQLTGKIIITGREQDEQP